MFTNLHGNEVNEDFLYTKLDNSYHLAYLGQFNLLIFNNYVKVY